MEKIQGINKTIEEQIFILQSILMQNEDLWKTLKCLQQSKMENYYVAAGSINQTVFNYYHDYPFSYGIKDFDIVYFDEDISYEAEDTVIQYIHKLLEDVNISFDIKNQARVHLWYQDKFGKSKEPLASLEAGINDWGASITSVGVRLENDKLIVYAPYGLNDIFAMVVRPIKNNFTKEHYIHRAEKWKAKWPKLTILPWDDVRERK